MGSSGGAEGGSRHEGAGEGSLVLLPLVVGDGGEVPDRRDGVAEVRVVDQNGLSRFGVIAMDGPVVGSSLDYLRFDLLRNVFDASRLFVPSRVGLAC